MAPVLVIEGKKACDAAAWLLPTFAVITNLGDINDSDWSPLRGRAVTIWPNAGADADAAGLTFAKAAAKAILAAGASSVATIAPDVAADWDDALPIDWNVTDALAAGWDEKRAIAFVASAALIVDDPRKRLKKMRKWPLYKITPIEKGDPDAWYKGGGDVNGKKSSDGGLRRAKIANKMTWLGWNKYDYPVRKAFNFFELDETNPYHWRILITYLAYGFFNLEDESGPRLKTMIENSKLLEDSLKIQNAKRATGIIKNLSDTEIIAILKKGPSVYSEYNDAALRKKLKEARVQAGWPLPVKKPTAPGKKIRRTSPRPPSGSSRV
ncbi:hypothetical protein [Bradyrhizobium sp. dw_78]|uniref:hypothetical protein n=1 Tax=Bradyrhizobium sp. dw_78 TaxID=2719793 RepID=UPI001BD439EB|nr:hypothetical protein [Bradyrhizobium sp. dw_78]